MDFLFICFHLTKNSNQEKNYSDYYTKSQENKNVIPNLKGMSGMDAVAILGNLKVKVKVIGVGKVKRQSLNPGQAIKSDTIITLELSWSINGWTKFDHDNCSSDIDNIWLINNS